MTQATKAFLTIGLLLLAACDNQHTNPEYSYLLEPEHINAAELELAIVKHKDFQSITENIDIHLSKNNGDPQKLFISGSQQSMAQVIALAQALDTPQSYVLEISNQKPGSISTSSQQAKVFLQPEEVIRLGLTDNRHGPWYEHFERNIKAIELELSNQLHLKIKIQERDKKLEANLDLKLDAWVPVFKLTSGGQLMPSASSTSYSTRDNTSPRKEKRINLRERELWLRLSRP